MQFTLKIVDKIAAVMWYNDSDSNPLITVCLRTSTVNWYCLYAYQEHAGKFSLLSHTAHTQLAAITCT